jgi:hypothetical protein
MGFIALFQNECENGMRQIFAAYVQAGTSYHGMFFFASSPKTQSAKRRKFAAKFMDLIRMLTAVHS